MLSALFIYFKESGKEIQSTDSKEPQVLKNSYSKYGNEYKKNEDLKTILYFWTKVSRYNHKCFQKAANIAKFIDNKKDYDKEIVQSGVNTCTATAKQIKHVSIPEELPQEVKALLESAKEKSRKSSIRIASYLEHLIKPLGENQNENAITSLELYLEALELHRSAKNDMEMIPNIYFKQNKEWSK